MIGKIISMMDEFWHTIHTALFIVSFYYSRNRSECTTLQLGHNEETCNRHSGHDRMRAQVCHGPYA